MLSNKRHFGNNTIAVTGNSNVIHKQGETQVIPPATNILARYVLAQKLEGHPNQHHNKKGSQKPQYPAKNERISIAGDLHHEAAVQPIVSHAEEKVNEHGSETRNLVPVVEVPVALVGKEIVIVHDPPVSDKNDSAVNEVKNAGNQVQPIFFAKPKTGVQQALHIKENDRPYEKQVLKGCVEKYVSVRLMVVPTGKT